MRWRWVTFALAGSLCAALVASASPPRSSAASGAARGCCALPRDVRACDAGEGRQLVARFVAAFDAGRIRELDRIFARKPYFQWYSTGPPGARFGADATNRSTLMPYFARRHRHAERLRLLQFGGGNSGGYFNFSFHVFRQARDLRAPGEFQGKGAVICGARGNTIAVWSLGGRVVAGR